MRRKQELAWVLTIVGIAGFAAAVIRMRAYALAHETMTETQLSIWGIQHWWMWGPAAIIMCVGLWLLHDEKEGGQ